MAAPDKSRFTGCECTMDCRRLQMEAKATMAGRGAYSTRQRSVILDYLRANPRRKLTVDDLSAALCVGRTTIYRLMETLAEQGDVHKYLSAEGARCYQYVENPAACALHAHAVCTCCGELVHLECGFVGALAKHMRSEHGFLLDEKRTVLYGCCERCTRAGEADGIG